VIRQVEWRVILWSALLWGILGPLLSTLLWGAVAMSSGQAGWKRGAFALVVIWPIFAPGAAVSGALYSWLLIRRSRRYTEQTGLRLRGLAWGAGLGLVGFLWGLLLLDVLTEGEGPARSWGELGWALMTIPAERPEVLVSYGATLLSGAVLGWVVAGWAGPESPPRRP
jgi:hypothetical protein